MNTLCTPLENTAGNGLKYTIYIFIRTDLSVEQQMVQAAHAAAEASRRYYQAEHGVASLVVLAVPNVLALYKAQAYLEELNLEHAMFFEPDWNMGHSALATRPVLDEERKLFRGWRLWKFQTAKSLEGASA